MHIRIMLLFEFLLLSFFSFCRYCVAGTIGHKLMSGKPTKIDLDKDTQIDVRCQVDAHLLKIIPFSFYIYRLFFSSSFSSLFDFRNLLHSSSKGEPWMQR